MKKGIFRIISCIMVASLMATIHISTSADSPVFGNSTIVSEKILSDNVNYQSLKALNGSVQQNIHKVTLGASSEYMVMPYFGNDLKDRNTLTQMASLISNDGYSVIAGVNGDFYNVDGTVTGMPVGPLIKNDVIVCSEDIYPNITQDKVPAWQTIGFRRDGTATLSHLTFDKSMVVVGKDGSSSNYNFTLFNRNLTSSGVHVYTQDFGTSVGNTNRVFSAVLTVSQGRFSVGRTVVCTVDSVSRDIANVNIPNGKVVLCVEDNDENSDLISDLYARLSYGQRVDLKMSAGNEWINVFQAISGPDAILNNGIVTTNPFVKDTNYPATLIGVKSDSTCVLVQIDGRNIGGSHGVSAQDAGKYMSELGCVNAIMVDGGGSSEMVIKSDDAIVVANNPSDGNERAVGTGLFIVSKDDNFKNPPAEYEVPSYSDDTVYAWSLPTAATANWKISKSDPFSYINNDIDINGVDGDGINVTTQNGSLNISKPSGNNWPCVRFTVPSPCMLDMTSNYLHYSIETNCSFKIAINYLYNSDDSPDSGWLKNQRVISKLISNAEVDVPAGSYNSTGISLVDFIDGCNSKIQIISIDIWVVGMTYDGSNCNIRINDFGIGKKDITKTTKISLNREKWTSIGTNNADAIQQDDGLKLARISDPDAYFLFQYNDISAYNPLTVDTTKHIKLGISLVADNGYNVSFLVRNPHTGKFGKIKLNNYLTYKSNNGYGITYGDNCNGGSYSIDKLCDIADMINVAISNNDGEVSGWGFTMPSDGIVDIYEIRAEVTYVPINDGILLKSFEFGLADNLIANSTSVTLNPDLWKVSYGSNCSVITTENGIKFKHDGAVGGFNDMGFQYRNVSFEKPINANVNNATMDIKLLADNGLTMTFLVRNPITGKYGKLKLNQYLSEKQGKGYDYQIYGDRFDNGYFEEDDHIQIKDMINTALSNNDNEVSGWGFTIPDDGIIEIYEIRFGACWIGQNEGLELKSLTFNNTNSDSSFEIKGAKIRTDGKYGIRFYSELSLNTDNKIVKGTDTFTVTNYGTLVCFEKRCSNENSMMIGNDSSYVIEASADYTMDESNNRKLFATTITNMPDDCISDLITVRGYVECSNDKTGEATVFYTNLYSRSINQVITAIVR